MRRRPNIVVSANGLTEDLAGYVAGPLSLPAILEELAVCPDVLDDEPLCREMLAPVLRKYRNHVAAWLVYSATWQLTNALAKLFVFAGALTDEERWERELLSDREGQTQAEKDWWARSRESLLVD